MRRFLLAVVALGAAVAPLSACGTSPGAESTGSASVAGPGTVCGDIRTAAGYPATERIVRGQVSCADVTHVFTDYYAALGAGRAPGNGGGGPVRVDGWVCESTPATASDPTTTCDRGADEITAQVHVTR